MEPTILNSLLAEQPIPCTIRPIQARPDELAHIAGTQEPIRDYPDDRARFLLTIGWLTVEYVHIDLPENERAARVSAIQAAARAWLKQPESRADQAARDQVRWLIEKTRQHESTLQIAQRVWLALVLYHLGCRGLHFDSEGRIRWQGGMAGRIGLAPDEVIDLAWQQENHQTYTASFRQADGVIRRGKGRRRWDVYRLTIHPDAEMLFKRRAKRVDETVALIVASEIFATQPQLPRDFYGGDVFQQACIDAQDQQFDHILVLSPEHGVISLDDVVPSERLWDDVLERRIWTWQVAAHNRLGRYLFGAPKLAIPHADEVNWWAWLNPESRYTFTVFGSGFAVRILIDNLLRMRGRMPHNWPEIVVAEPRPGYDVGDFEGDSGFGFDFDDEFEDEDDFAAALRDIDQLLEWAAEFVTLVNLYLPPTGETWEMAPDEALVPVRLLSETEMDLEDLFDLLTDITLLLERPLPFSAILNASPIVATLLQITHSLVHDDREPIAEMLDAFAEPVLRQYVETAMQQTSLEDRLCACLTLAEQMQLLAQTIPASLNEQLLVWFQTYLSGRMRHNLMNQSGER